MTFFLLHFFKRFFCKHHEKQALSPHVHIFGKLEIKTRQQNSFGPLLTNF
jgi:hypothetical protein